MQCKQPCYCWAHPAAVQGQSTCSPPYSNTLYSYSYGDKTSLHSNSWPLFGTGAHTAQNSPTTVNNLTFPLCTHPSTLNRKKCAVQVHLTEKGRVATFGQKKAPKCVAVRVLLKFENFKLLWNETPCVALISFKLSTFLTWYNCNQNVLKINALTTHVQKLCRVTWIRRFVRKTRSGAAKLKRWASCSAVQVLEHSTFWF